MAGFIAPIAGAAVRAVAPAVMNAVSGMGSAASGRAATEVALGAGTENLSQKAQEIQQKFGVTPDQAVNIASHIQDKERDAQRRDSQGSIYENAALRNKGNNLAAERDLIANAQVQQSNLANQLVNSVQNARDAAARSVEAGANAAAQLLR